MYNISIKYKPFYFLLIKLAIVCIAFFFIYQKLTDTHLLSFTLFWQNTRTAFSKNYWFILILLLYTDANWLLEMMKWKILASVEKNISFLESYEQSLAALTTSLITPNRIGEYGAKAMYFEKNKRKKIVLLNLIGNLSQLLVTMVFGLIGFIFFTTNHSFEMPHFNQKKIILIFGVILLFGFTVKYLELNIIVKQLYTKIVNYFKLIPKIIFSEILIISILRYLIFTHQFYYLLLIFGVDFSYFTLISFIFCVYFIASVIPNISFFDWAIKGSVAVWIFSFIGVNELTIVIITSIMWLLNFALPAILGSIFVLNFKLTTKE